MFLLGWRHAAPRQEQRQRRRRIGGFDADRLGLFKNRAAATIGPMVCEDDGPPPTLNMSNTERNMRQPCGLEKKVPVMPSAAAARMAAGRCSMATRMAFRAGKSAGLMLWAAMKGKAFIQRISIER